MRIKENPKAFFSFARSRQRTKAKVWPLLDENGEPDPSPGIEYYIHPQLLLVLIIPIHKCGSRSAPKNYRPGALTSHLIKVCERVLRHALVQHIEKLGLLPDG